MLEKLLKEAKKREKESQANQEETRKYDKMVCPLTLESNETLTKDGFLTRHQFFCVEINQL